MIQLFVNDLNSELQVLFVHMTSTGMSFNVVIDFVKKVEKFNTWLGQNIVYEVQDCG